MMMNDDDYYNHDNDNDDDDVFILLFAKFLRRMQKDSSRCPSSWKKYSKEQFS